MNDPVLVRAGEGREHASRDLQRLVKRQLALAAKPLAEGSTVHHRHYVPQVARGFAGVEQWQDARVLEASSELDLTQKAGGAKRGGAERAR